MFAAVEFDFETRPVVVLRQGASDSPRDAVDIQEGTFRSSHPASPNIAAEAIRCVWFH